MIPARVSLKNFLTFAADTDGTPLVLDFDGAALWSIAGVNGAGKSAIFDAITYTLYGEHRGGRQHDNRLIRKGATTAEVVFEFHHGSERYRVERSITRKLGRQGQPRPDAKHVQASIWVDSDQAWVAIPDTDKPTELEKWVRSLLGMGPETFRSSVLLRQGEADKLLNAKASQRFEILAGLIDLRVYQRLEQLAVQRRRVADTNVGVLDKQLAEVDDVTDEQLSDAVSQLETADRAVETADMQRLEADRRWQDAQRYARLQARWSDQTRRKEELDRIVSNAQSIRSRDAERRRVEETIKPVTDALADLNEAAATSESAANALERLGAIDLAALELTAAESVSTQQGLDKELERLNERASHLALVFASAKEVRHSRGEQDSRARKLETIGDPTRLGERVTQLDQQLGETRARVTEQEARRSEAIDRRGAAQSQLDRARERLATLDDLAQEPTCSRCGQPVAAEHLQRERDEAETELESATATLAAERAAAEELEDSLAKAKDATDDLDRRHREALRTADIAGTAKQELDRAITQVHAAVADAKAVSYDAPEADLLTAVIESPLDDAEQALQSLTTLGETTKATIQQTKKDREKAKTFAQTAQTTLADGRRNHADLERAALDYEARSRHLTERAELRLEGLPADVATAVRVRNHEIREQLQARLAALADAPGALVQLETAETELNGVTATLRSIESDLALVQPEHQVPADGALTSLEQAQQSLKDAQAHRDKSRDEHTRLSEAHQARRELSKQLAAARQRSRIARRLAVLLGRAELQARLLTEATTGMEAYANDTLARISAGTLEIALRQGEGGDQSSLDIFVNDRSSAGEPLDVAFISGSQKFRVAVALAAGLGQYLGGSTAIRSLIIDEGFGSLDADGRQRMIDELRALAEHLDRIIVVSHQEDFEDRTLFPTGFVLRKSGTRTTVERVG
jgi:DNA repair protein SbcC/Rad50